jgi:hypothetical protein
LSAHRIQGASPIQFPSDTTSARFDNDRTLVAQGSRRVVFAEARDSNSGSHFSLSE